MALPISSLCENWLKRSWKFFSLRSALKFQFLGHIFINKVNKAFVSYKKLRYISPIPEKQKTTKMHGYLQMTLHSLIQTNPWVHQKDERLKAILKMYKIMSSSFKSYDISLFTVHTTHIRANETICHSH